MEPSSPRVKKYLIISQKKLFLYSAKWNFLKKTCYVPGGNFPSSKNKTTHFEKNSYILGNRTF